MSAAPAPAAAAEPSCEARACLIWSRTHSSLTPCCRSKCNYIPSKQTWRWQCRSKPAPVTLERKSPASSFIGFLHKKRSQIAPDCITDLESCVPTLQQQRQLVSLDSGTTLQPSSRDPLPSCATMLDIV